MKLLTGAALLALALSGCGGPSLADAQTKCERDLKEEVTDAGYVNSDGYFSLDGDVLTVRQPEPGDSQTLFAFDGAKCVINETGGPSSIGSKIQTTKGIDGRQSDTYGNLEVSWTYDPDHGLQVIFEPK